MATTIDSPTDGDDLPSSAFYVTGTWGDQPVPLYAYIMTPSGPRSGFLINNPPNYVFEFQNVPTGTGCVLTVMDYQMRRAGRACPTSPSSRDDGTPRRGA